MLEPSSTQRLMIKYLTIMQVELEFGNVSLDESRKPEPRERTLEARVRTNNKLNPHMTPSPGIERETHWWEASALTAAPSLLPKVKAI